MTPQAFEIVEFPRVFREDVDDEIPVVHKNPLGVVVAFDAVRPFAGFCQFVANGVADRLDLSRVGSAADNEEVGKRRNLAKVEDADRRGLFRFGGADGG
jgi:hypothetical protein